MMKVLINNSLLTISILACLYAEVGKSQSLTTIESAISGSNAEGQFGFDLDLSSDGSVVVIGAYSNDGAAADAGRIEVYELASGSWSNIGNFTGAASGDETGYSVAISDDGTRLAYGSRSSDDGGTDAGKITVFDYNGSSWDLVGTEILGETDSDGFGSSVAISGDGNRIAGGAILNDGNGSEAGHIRVYEWNGTEWAQLGSDIDGDVAGDRLGTSVALSEDGSRLVVGAHLNDTNGSSAGQVKVFDWDGSSWTQVGSDIYGDSGDDLAGWSVAISHDGSRIAFGATGSTVNSNTAGYVKVYDFDTDWAQAGSTISGEAINDQFGYSVSLTNNGNYLAVGANLNDDGGTDAGKVYWYAYDGSDWSLDVNTTGSTGVQTGTSVALSGDGTTIAVGSDNPTGTGFATIYARSLSTTGKYEFAGNAFDESGNGNNGTIVGATTTADRFGITDAAYSLDGTDDYIELSSLTGFGSALNEFAISFWVKSNTSAETSYLYSGYNEADNQYLDLFIDSFNGVLDASISDQSGSLYRFQASIGSLLDDSWHHLVINIQDASSNEGELFIDNVKQALTTVTAGGPSTFGTLDNGITLGAFDQGTSGTSLYFEGELDDVELFDHSLNTTDIEGLFEASTDEILRLNYAVTPSIDDLEYSGTSLGISTVELSPAGIAFSADGSKMFVIGENADAIHTYDLSTNYALSSATWSSSYSVSSQGTDPQGIHFKEDGRKLFMVDASTNSVFSYDLTTPFDLSTATFDTSESISAQTTDPTDIYLSRSGSTLFIVTSSGVFAYTMSSSFDINTMSVSTSVTISSETSSATGVVFDPLGETMYISGSDAIYQYTLPAAYSLTGASQVPILASTVSLSTEENSIEGLAFNAQGTKLYVAGDETDAILEYDLSTAAFTESSADDGSLEGALIVSIIGDTFTNQNSSFTQGTHYTINNLPSGLTPSFEVSLDGDYGIVSLSGNATNADDDNDVNLEFTFTDAAFTNASVDDVENAQDYSSLGIDFITPSTLVALYDFTGNTLDGSEYENNLTNVGASLTSDRFSQASSAYTFNGSAYLSATHISQYNVGTDTDFAISGWFNSTSTSASNGVILEKSDGDTGFFVQLRSDGSIYFFLEQAGTSVELASSTTGLNDGSWHHFIVQADRDGGLAIYIDRTEDVSSDVLSNTLDLDNSEDLLIGANREEAGSNTISFQFVGDLDDIKYYTALLSSEEITELYNNGVNAISVAGTSLTDDLDLVLSGSLGDASSTWGGVAELSAGNLTFYLNNDNTVLYGDSDADGQADASGTEISLSEGLYYIEFTPAMNNYTVSEITSVGFIGTARTGDDSGWDDPDTDMTDEGNGVYSLSEQTLFDGVWKVRANDVWTLGNWGDDGADGTLELSGANIAIEAGIYDIKVDIINNTYTVETTKFGSINYAKSPDVDDATYSANSFSVASQDTDPTDIKFNADGTKMFVVGLENDNINEYTLSTAYDLSTASFVTAFNVSTQEANPFGLAFNTDGTKMFMTGNALSSSNSVFEYDLSTGFDLSTAVYNSNFVVVESGDALPRGLTFNNDGSKMYISGGNANAIVEYDLSTSFDVTTATFVDATSVATEDGTIMSFVFNKDGSKLYLLGRDNRSVFEYELSTAFDASSLSLSKSYVIDEESLPNGITFSSDGTQMFILGEASATIFEYDMGSYAFAENSSNDGSVSGSLISEISGDTFANADGTLTEGTHFSISDRLSGLIASMNVANDGQTAVLTFSGDADNSTNFDDIDDLELNFLDAAFTTYEADQIAGASEGSSGSLGIDFLGSEDLVIGDYEMDNNIEDESVNANDGQLGDGVTSSTFPTATTDRFSVTDGAYSFASDDYITIPNATNYEFGTDMDFSISLWVNSSNTGTTQTLVSKTNGTSTSETGFDVSINTADQVVFSLLSGGTEVQTAASSTDVVDGTWHHVVLTADRDAGLSMFINGSLDNAGTDLTNTLDINSTNDLFVGVALRDGFTDYFTGTLDQLMVFSAALTLSEVEELYHNFVNSVTLSGTAFSSDFELVRQGDLGARSIWGGTVNLADAGEFNYVVTDGTSFGEDDSDNIADKDGASIAINSGLNYVGFNSLSNAYNIIEITSLGVLGDALSGFEADDTDLTSSGGGVFEITNLTMTSGEIKFRANDAWDANWGDDGADGTLDIYGSNIAVEAGIYNISVDIINNTYSLERNLDVQLTYSISPEIGRASYTGSSLSVGDVDTNPSEVKFNPDGTKMYVLGLANDEVSQFGLSTAYDLSTAGLESSFSVSAQETNPFGLAFSGDGTKMFVVGNSGSVNNAVHEYDLSTGFDVSTATYSSNFIEIENDDANPRGVAFNKDGTKMFVTGGGAVALLEYNLSTAYDVTTASLVDATDVSSEDATIMSFVFNADGSRLYLIGRGSQSIFEYSLTTAFDLSTLVLTANYLINEESLPNGIAFSTDGTRMFVVGETSDAVFEYSLGQNAFYESTANDGSVDGSLIISIVGDTFTNAGGAFTDGSEVTVGNVPSGLSPVVDISDDGLNATVTLSGNAVNNFDADDVSDITFNFADAAFTLATATDVTNATGPFSTNLGIDFSGASELVGYYTFDNTILDDQTGNGYDGTTPQGIGYSSDRYGNSESAIEPVNDGSYVEISHSGDWGFKGEFAYVTWVRPNSFDDNDFINTIIEAEGILGIRANPTDPTRSNVLFHWQEDDSNYPTIETAGTIDLNTWTHVALTVDANNDLRIFINGVQQNIKLDTDTDYTTEINITRVSGNETTELYIGTAPGNTDRHFDGSIDDVRIYAGGTLSASEVQSIYNSELSGGADRLVARYSFSSSSLSDESDNVFDGSMTNVNSSAITGIFTTGLAGDENGAVLLENTGDYVDFNHNSSINLRRGFTVNFWTNPNSVSTSSIGDVLFSDGGTPAKLMAESDGSIFYYYQNDAQTDFISISEEGTSLTTEGWQMITYSIDENDLLNVYHNGSKIITDQSVADATYVPTESFTLALNDGGSGDGERYFDGAMDELSVYQRVLDDAEIAALFDDNDNRIVAYLPFDGNASDESGNGLDGTVVGAVLGNDRQGEPDLAYSFDGVDDYISLPTISESLSSGLTIASWVNLSSQTAWATVLTLGDSDGGYLSLNFAETTTDFELVVSDGTNATQLASENTIGLNTWAHIAATIDDSGNAVMYLNGLQISSGSISTPSAAEKTQNFIGRAVAGDGYLNGTVDELRLYNTALSSGEISDLFNTERSDLIGYYTFTGDATDDSGYGFDGTNTDATLAADRYGFGSQAYDFNGSSSQISSVIDFHPLGEVTVSYLAWINPDVSNQTGGIIAFGDNGDDQMSALVLNNGQLIYQGGNNDVASGYSPTVGAWTHVAVVKSGTTVSFYADGQLQFSGSTSNGQNLTNTSLLIGSSLAAEYFDGLIDEIRVYDVALSASEVAAIYAEEEPTTEVPEAPSDVTSTVIGSGAVRVAWADNSDIETSYFVQYNDGSGDVNAGTLDPDVTSQIITGLTNDVEYTFTVFASNLNGTTSSTNSATATPVLLTTPIVAYTPDQFSLDDELTITVFTDRTYPPGDLSSAGKVYLHSGLIDSGSENQTGWTAAPDNNYGEDNGVGEMTDNGDGSWSITLTDLRTYYGVDADHSASQIGMVFRNEDGTLFGGKGYEADGSGQDFFIHVFDSSLVERPAGLYGVFDGGNSLSLATNSATTPGAFTDNASISLEAWINPDQMPGTDECWQIFGRDFSSNDPFTAYQLLYCNTAGSEQLRFTISDGTTSSAVSAALTLTQSLLSDWNHVVGTYDGSTVKLYLNGYEIASTISSITLPTSTGDNDGVNVGGSAFSGFIDELRLWNTFRTTDEIRVNISSEIEDPTTVDELVGYWQLNGFDDTNNTTPDSSGNANNLSLNGSVFLFPDLTVDITDPTSGISFNVGTEVTISGDLMNSGTAEASGQVTYRHVLSSNTTYGDSDDLELYTEQEDITLGLSQSTTYVHTYSLSTNLTPGSYNLIIRADDSNMIDELDEENNTAILSVEITNLQPDLSITIDNPADDNETFVLGESRAVDYTITNQSSATLMYDGDVTSALWLSQDAELGDEDILLAQETEAAAISIGTSESFTWSSVEIPDGTSEGSYFIIAQVDETESIDEVDETNNSFSRIIQVAANAPLGVPSNLSATGLTASGFQVTWDAVTDATRYLYDLAFDENFASIVNNIADVSTTATSASFSGLNENTTYYFRVKAQDASTSRESPYSTTLEVATTGDSEAPVITISAQVNKAIPSEQEITINTTDDTGVIVVRFFKRRAESSPGSESFEDFSASVVQPNNSFTATISASDFDDTGVTMFAVGFDEAGNRSDTSNILTIVTDIEETQVINIPIQTRSEEVTAYRIFAFPYENKSVTDVVSGGTRNTDWKVQQYSGSENPSNPSSLTAGQGYWFLTSNDNVTMSFSGASPRSITGESFPIVLSSGWNQIGNPFLKTLNWSDVLEYNGLTNGEISTSLFVYTGFGSSNGYNQSSTLNVHEGAFVESDQSRTLEIPISAVGRTDGSTDSWIVKNGGWEVDIDISAPDGFGYGISGFGQFSRASQGVDNFDFKTPVLFDKYVKAVFTENELAGFSIARSLHEVRENDSWNMQVESHFNSGAQMTLTFNGIPELPIGNRMIMLDLETGQSLELADGAQYDFSFKPGYQFKFITGSADYINAELVLNQLISSQVSPNPNAGTFKLPVYLPVTDGLSVQAEVIDLTGRVLWNRLVSVSGGYQELEVALPSGTFGSGLYLLKLSFPDTPVLNGQKITKKVYLTRSE